ncbi:hypothetical protein [Halocatena marina]|uniref:Uncharacterized protein n=1 Tax=Halocatena marina TaxID=2934937 RepID=A0ABD5YYE2_9EURY|nr:hypothetical protein [Halocatena marina]
MGLSTATPPDQDQNQELVTKVACPRCEQLVTASIPDREVDPTVSSYVAAFGDHSIVHCPNGHKFWVYYC